MPLLIYPPNQNSSYLYLWNMMHVTGIPHNPTGQAKWFMKIILQ